MLLHQLGALVAGVELVRCAIGVPALGEDKNIFAQHEGIRVDSGRAQVDVRVIAGSLAGRAT